MNNTTQTLLANSMGKSNYFTILSHRVKPMTNETTVNERLDNIENTLAELGDKLTDILEHLTSSNRSMGNTPIAPAKKPKALMLLQEIYKRDGLVAKEDLNAIAQNIGVKHIGPYFRGRNSSLSIVRKPDGVSVALTESGYNKLLDAHLISS